MPRNFSLATKGQTLGGELRAGRHTLPSPDTLRMARLRLDMLSIMFERQVFMQYAYFRYIWIDGSPQLGWNWLVMREDRLRIARCNENAVFEAWFAMSTVYERRTCVASVVGHKNANLAKKSINTANNYLAESDSDEMFLEKRREVKGCTPDQGTEMGIADDALQLLPRFKDYVPRDVIDGYMYPCCL